VQTNADRCVDGVTLSEVVDTLACNADGGPDPLQHTQPTQSVSCPEYCTMNFATDGSCKVKDVTWQTLKVSAGYCDCGCGLLTQKCCPMSYCAEGTCTPAGTCRALPALD
jgi:hypothetical protein